MNCRSDVEIVDLTILDRTHVPTGTIFLLCSASHLNNVGSSIYATDWCNAVAKFSTKIRNVKIMPLTPIIRKNSPGSLKVPKREIFDRWNFPDFYIIKSLCGGDFGVKIKENFTNN